MSYRCAVLKNPPLRHINPQLVISLHMHSAHSKCREVGFRVWFANFQMRRSKVEGEPRTVAIVNAPAWLANKRPEAVCDHIISAHIVRHGPSSNDKRSQAGPRAPECNRAGLPALADATG